jgi:hypothetical protein
VGWGPTPKTPKEGEVPETEFGLQPTLFFSLQRKYHIYFVLILSVLPSTLCQELPVVNSIVWYCLGGSIS